MQFTDWSVKYTINVQLSKKYVTGFLYLRTPLVPIFNLVQFLKAKILLFKRSMRWLKDCRVREKDAKYQI